MKVNRYYLLMADLLVSGTRQYTSVLMQIKSDVNVNDFAESIVSTWWPSNGDAIDGYYYNPDRTIGIGVDSITPIGDRIFEELSSIFPTFK